jgi:Yip1 domain
VPSTDTVQPLRDVWLRPRRVFRELAASPIGITDYGLAAAQGIATAMTWYRSPMAGTHIGAPDILRIAIMLGPVGGILSTFLFAAIYGRLGQRFGGTSSRNQVFHVLAYGGLPVAASLLLSGFTALLVGEAAIIDVPGLVDDGFVAFVLRVQFVTWVFLLLWSVVLQVMGLSEVMGLTALKALGVYVLGQILAALIAFFLAALIIILAPGFLPAAPH